jgi:GDP-L-fucose synthase
MIAIDPHKWELDRNTAIFLAGHRGMVGSAIHRRLVSEGFGNIITRDHNELDLCNQAAVRKFFNQNEIGFVILAAAKVGGILANSTHPAEFIYQNLMITTNVVHEAFKAGICRLLFLGSSCIYPKNTKQPIREEALLSGYLEATNEAYAVAKIAGIKLCQSYNRQYGMSYRSLMPSNLYGPNDNFDLENSHVLPAMIRKFHLGKLALRGDWEAIRNDEARLGRIPEDFSGDLQAVFRERNTLKKSGRAGIRLWGSGKPRREFLHVDDLASACCRLMNLPDEEFGRLCEVHPPGIDGPPVSHINVGSGEDLTVSALAEITRKAIGFPGAIVWDRSKPDGTPRKLLDIQRLKSIGWEPCIRLEEGIRDTYAWYLNQV